MSSSAIIKTEAITLRTAAFSNTSHIITWFTPGHGRIATVAKGALRPKSPLMGQYDTGYLCELLFYGRNRNGLHIIRECCALDMRRNCRGAWRPTASLNYLCHLTTIATPDGAHAPELYSLLKHNLHRIDKSAAKRDAADTTAQDYSTARLAGIMLQFEIQLLKLLGISPRLEHCTVCSSPLAPPGSHIFFSADNGGVVCHNCAHGSLPQISALALETLQLWQNSPPHHIIPLPPDTIIAETSRVMGYFLTSHMDLSPACRAVAYQTAAIPNS